MLQVVDKEGKKYLSYEEENIDNLRGMCKNNVLVCPECKNPVNIKAGPKKINHFAHKPGSECTYPYWEPESEQHLKGKLMLKEWLDSIYPNSKVELEYKVDATNQRSDVMVIHPNGVHEAFEFQCSSITEEVIKERHELYKIAKVKDTWIFGDTVHTYHEIEDEDPKGFHKFRGMELGVYDFQKNVYYLNPFEGQLRGLFDFKHPWNYSKTILEIEEELMELRKSFFHKVYIFNEEMKNWYEEKLLRDKKAEEERKRRKYEKKMAPIWAKEKRLSEKEQRVIELTQDKDSLKNRMTKQEIALLVKLRKKHGFEWTNFPGCLHIKVPDDDLIITPNYVWQLWIYDKFIYNKKNELKVKVWVPNVYEEFKKMVSMGIFRTKHGGQNRHYSFAIFDFFKYLSSVDLFTAISRDGKYYRINCDEYPSLENKSKNILVCLGIENSYHHIDDISGTVEALRAFVDKAKEIANKKMQKMREQKKQQSNNNQIATIVRNVIKRHPSILSDWEKDFIIKIAESNYILTNKQIKIIDKCAEKIEKELEITIRKN